MTCTACCVSQRPAASPLRKFSWYRRLHAWALAQGNARYEAAIHDAKEALLGRLSGRVLELGPGVGANLPFYRRDVQWVGVEPNHFAHPYLHDKASRLGLSAEVHAGVAECLPLPDASVDAVAVSLVLCTVEDPATALSEIRRVLKPGGKFVFIEHVAARPGSRMRRLQRALRGPQAWLGDGCRPDRETLKKIESAGFTWVVSCSERMPVPLVSPHILGYAIR